MAELPPRPQTVLTAWKELWGNSLEKREGEKGREGEGKEREYKIGVL